jgi:hypothetical protein
MHYAGWLIVLRPATPNTDLLWQAIFAVILWIWVGIVTVSQRHVQFVSDNKLQRKVA